VSVRTLLSASELATAEIRDLIEAGTLLPGQRIHADELAERLMISRTPIRDALQRLQSEGLVEILPRKGVFVRRISAQEVEDVYRLKGAVEPMAAAWAAERGSDAARSALTAALGRLQDAARDGDVDLAAVCVDEIHTQLFTMAGSEVLLDVYRVVHGRVKLLRRLNMAQPGRLQSSVEQHEQIVGHVVAGRAARAGRQMARHMSDAAESVRKVLPD